MCVRITAYEHLEAHGFGLPRGQRLPLSATSSPHVVCLHGSSRLCLQGPCLFVLSLPLSALPSCRPPSSTPTSPLSPPLVTYACRWLRMLLRAFPLHLICNSRRRRFLLSQGVPETILIEMGIVEGKPVSYITDALRQMVETPRGSCWQIAFSRHRCR